MVCIRFVITIIIHLSPDWKLNAIWLNDEKYDTKKAFTMCYILTVNSFVLEIK